MTTQQHTRARGWGGAAVRAIAVAVTMAGAIAWVGGAGGCFTYHAGSLGQTRAGSVGHTDAAAWSESLWPSRDLAAVEPFREATPRVVYAYDIDPATPEDEVSEEAKSRAATADKHVLFNEICGNGLFRVLRDPHREQEAELASAWDAWEDVLYGFVPNAYFLSSYTVGTASFERSIDGEKLAQETPLLIPVNGLRRRPGPPLMLNSGIDVRVPDLDGETPRGILVRFTAIMGTSYEQAVVNHLADRGWAVLHISTRSSVKSPNEAAILDAYEQRRARASELLAATGILPPWQVKVSDGQLLAIKQGDAGTYARAFKATHEQAAAEIPIPPSGFEPASASDEEIEAAAIRIARAVDETLAENAYAAEAGLEYIRRLRPDWAELPVAVIGFSAGALAAPAAAARLGDRVSAVVLIGGGADLFRIAMDSELTNGGIRLSDHGKRPPREIVERLAPRYLEHVRFDPYQLGPRLAGKRVLVVYGEFDAIVPGSAGRRLVRQLGNPDRLVFWGGHKGLFYFMPRRARWIGDWLEEAVARGEPAT